VIDRLIALECYQFKNKLTAYSIPLPEQGEVDDDCYYEAWE